VAFPLSTSRFVEDHLGSTQVARVIYGAIIGLDFYGFCAARLSGLGLPAALAHAAAVSAIGVFQIG
jgi:hypothetical protein